MDTKKPYAGPRVVSWTYVYEALICSSNESFDELTPIFEEE